MDILIAWCAFAGAWLLVAGSLYQAALELNEEEFQRDDMRRLNDVAGQPPPLSRWWWLLPPVAYVLRRRRSERWREAVIGVMSAEQLEKLMHYLNKATGWLYVGAGGLLIAVSETWQLFHENEWPDGLFWVVVPLLALLCAVNVVLRLGRSNSIVARAQA